MTPAITEAERTLKRKKIIDAAMKLFINNGYENTKISQIVKEAGIAQGTFYLYFDSKEKILYALTYDLLHYIMHEVKQCIDSINSPLDKLDAAIDTISKITENEKNLLLLTHSSVAVSMIQSTDLEQDMMDILLKLIEALLQQGIELGEIRKCNIKYTAYFILSTIHTTLEQAILKFYPSGIKEVMPELKQFVRSALKA